MANLFIYCHFKMYLFYLLIASVIYLNTNFCSGSDNFEIIKDIHKDIKNSLSTLKKTRDREKRAKLKSELKSFRKELKER